MHEKERGGLRDVTVFLEEGATSVVVRRVTGRVTRIIAMLYKGSYRAKVKHYDREDKARIDFSKETYRLEKTMGWQGDTEEGGRVRGEMRVFSLLFCRSLLGSMKCHMGY